MSTTKKTTVTKKEVSGTEKLNGAYNELTKRLELLEMQQFDLETEIHDINAALEALKLVLG